MMLTPRPIQASLRFEKDKICFRCLARLIRPRPSPSLRRSSIHTKRKLHGVVTSEKVVVPQTFVHDYFSANNSIDRGWVKNGFMAAFRSIEEMPPKQANLVDNEGVLSKKEMDTHEPFTIPEVTLDAKQASAVPTSAAELPHRRRKRLKAERLAEGLVMPLDASSQLTTAATNLPSTATLRRRLATYLSLSKPRLSFLIILTTTSAYSLYPVPELLSSTTSLAPLTLSTSTLTLAYLSAGTFLSCACANTLNMLLEPRTDALMTRTRNRPLVRKLVSPGSATLFAFACGASGLTLLYLGTNPTVAGLSALNIFLYAGVYTPMKRISALNTWVGAVVGAIPPLMGWVAAAGQVATNEHHSWSDFLFSEEATGGWLLAGLLFAWQFPHFNSLSHSIKDDYRNAGLRMLCWTNPARNGRVAIRYSLLMFPVCFGLYYAGIVNSNFFVISTVANAWMTREAVRFWRRGGASGSARGLFWASVWHLPLILVGALVCKTGIWQGVWDHGIALAAGEEEADTQLRDGQEEEDGLMDVDLAVKCIQGRP